MGEDFVHKKCQTKLDDATIEEAMNATCRRCNEPFLRLEDVNKKRIHFDIY